MLAVCLTSVQVYTKKMCSGKSCFRRYGLYMCKVYIVQESHCHNKWTKGNLYYDISSTRS
ncbi:hypothetical protein Hanom_Chr07g00613571 [Helianthus anomalus]